MSRYGTIAAMRGRGECSVRTRRRKDGGAYYEARASIHGRQVSFYHGTKSGALAKARQARADSERGAAVLLPTVTVAVYLDTWLETVAPTVRPTTIDRYRRVCRIHVAPAIGRHRLAHLTPSHVEAMLAQLLAGGLAESTVRNIRTILSIALGAAERDYGLSRNASRIARMPKGHAAPFAPERVNTDDVRRVLSAVSGRRIEPAVLFSVATGVRKGELLALRHEDFSGESVTVRHTVDWSRQQLARPKSDSSVRVLRLSQTAMRAVGLERAYQAQERMLGDWHEMGLVFAGQHGGIRSGNWCNRRLTEALSDAGLPHVRWHALRRMFSALLLDQGVPLHRIRDLLGHSRVATTEMYAYTMPAALDRDMGSVDDVLG